MSVLFDNVKVGDTVHYSTPQGQSGKGKVVIHKGTHLVLNAGGRNGRPQVVTDKNYIKHSREGKVVGALLSRLSTKNEDYMNTEPHKWNYPDKPEGVLKLGKGQKAAMRKSAKAHDALLKKLHGKRSVKEDSKDAEGAAERVAKTKKHKKKLHELDNSTLASYVSKSLEDRKKAKSGFDMAGRIHTGERKKYFQDKMFKRIDKRTVGIQKAISKIAHKLPAEPVGHPEPLKRHSDSEGAKHGGWSGMHEAAAPGKEDWIKANKQRFIDRYGKEKGLRVLYAKAWKDSKNESVNEEIKRYTTHHDDYMVTSTTGPAGHTISVRQGGTLIAQRLGGKLITNSKSGKKDTKLQDVIKAHTDHPEVQKFLKTNEARESEYTANIQMAAGSGKAAKPAKGHYLMRDGRKLSGPHTPEEAYKAYKNLGSTDTKGIKIVHVKEGVVTDVTHMIMEAAKVKKAAEKAISLAKKAKGNKHVDTEPTLDVQDKGGGGPMGGSHEDSEGEVNAKV